MEMVTIKSVDSYSVGGYTVKAQFLIKQYYEFSDCFVSREEEANGNGHLFAYGYSKDRNLIKWKFPFDCVVGIKPIVPELKKAKDFVSQEHYNNYIQKFSGKELLEVYAGDFRFLLDANTGEIYDKVISR